MAITKKPKAKPAVDVEALISKGGSVAAEAPPPAPAERKPSPVVLRIPLNLIDRIEQSIRARPVKIPRHTWLLEAIVEKLDKEAAAGTGKPA